MSMCNVLGVLGDNEDGIRRTLDASVALAEAENARLTLVKTCDDGRAYLWITPFACGGVYVPPPIDCPDEAARLLARVAESVPGSIPVTTLVLGRQTQESLLKLMREGHFGAIVAEPELLRHCRRLRRQLRREEIRVVPVTLTMGEQDAAGISAAPFSSNGHTEDGVLDAVQVTSGSRRWNGGLWHWHTRRLAGAGGKQ